MHRNTRTWEQTHAPACLSNLRSRSPSRQPGWPSFSSLMEQHSSLCWRPLKRQLSRLECLSLSGMLFSVSHYPPSSSAWVTAIHSSGHFLREASLSSIRFCCYNLSSYSLLFLNYTNSTCNHFSSKTVIAKCNYTFMSIWQVNQSVLGVETIYSGHSREPQGPAQCQAFKECVWSGQKKK